MREPSSFGRAPGWDATYFMNSRLERRESDVGIEPSKFPDKWRSERFANGEISGNGPEPEGNTESRKMLSMWGEEEKSL